MYSKQLSNQRDFSFILMILVVLPLNGQLLDTGALSTKQFFFLQTPKRVTKKEGPNRIRRLRLFAKWSNAAFFFSPSISSVRWFPSSWVSGRCRRRRRRHLNRRWAPSLWWTRTIPSTATVNGRQMSLDEYLGSFETAPPSVRPSFVTSVRFGQCENQHLRNHLLPEIALCIENTYSGFEIRLYKVRLKYFFPKLETRGNAIGYGTSF